MPPSSQRTRVLQGSLLIPRYPILPGLNGSSNTFLPARDSIRPLNSSDPQENDYAGWADGDTRKRSLLFKGSSIFQKQVDNVYVNQIQTPESRKVLMSKVNSPKISRDQLSQAKCSTQVSIIT